MGFSQYKEFSGGCFENLILGKFQKFSGNSFFFCRIFEMNFHAENIMKNSINKKHFTSSICQCCQNVMRWPFRAIRDFNQIKRPYLWNNLSDWTRIYTKSKFSYSENRVWNLWLCACEPSWCEKYEHKTASTK